MLKILHIEITVESFMMEQVSISQLTRILIYAFTKREA